MSALEQAVVGPAIEVLANGDAEACGAGRALVEQSTIIPLAFDGRLQSTQSRQLPRSTGLTADPLSLIGGIVVGMERNQSKKVTIPERDRANALTESKRIHLCSVGCCEMLDEFPLKICMPIQRVPVQLPQAPQRSNDLLEVDDLKAEEHFLKLGAIEIQADTATGVGHECVRRVWSAASRDSRRPSPEAPFRRPT